MTTYPLGKAVGQPGLSWIVSENSNQHSPSVGDGTVHDKTVHGLIVDPAVPLLGMYSERYTSNSRFVQGSSPQHYLICTILETT